MKPRFLDEVALAGPEHFEPVYVAGYVVLIWTAGGHTYGVGFHNVLGLKRTLTLDRALAAGVKLTK